MKTMVGLIIAILIIFSYRLFWPSTEPELNHDNEMNVVDGIEPENNEIVETNSVKEDLSPSQRLSIPSDENKRKLMVAEYEILEQARNKLKKHIALLKHQMWGLKFPPESAKKISSTVMSANMLLKNPDMLGAFSSVEQIKDEVTKIEFAKKSLMEIDALIKTRLEDDSTNPNSE